jgi:hypothetical protein
VRDLYINPVVQGNQQAAFALWPVLKHMGRLLVARSQVRSMPRGSWPRIRYPPSSQGLLAARGYGGARTQVPGDGSPAH